jgi:hypothetical protein
MFCAWRLLPRKVYIYCVGPSSKVGLEHGAVNTVYTVLTQYGAYCVETILQDLLRFAGSLVKHMAWSGTQG